MIPVHWLFLIFTHFVIAPIAAFHALLYKRDPRAAFGWITVCLFFPILGPILYSFFGINRIRSRARRLTGRTSFFLNPEPDVIDSERDALTAVQNLPREFAELAQISEKVTRLPVQSANRIGILQNGEQAYPAMLKAIDQCRRTLILSTYIFETNTTGMRFIEALSRAAKRGVDVRVLLDGMGERYSSPRAARMLKRHSVPVALFLPPRVLPPSLFINLRNHRKLLVTDGQTAFCGGMNIGDRHLAEDRSNPSRVADIHFRFEGPVAVQLQRSFMETWRLCRGKKKDPAPEEPGPVPAGPVPCRAIVDGPDENIDKFANVLAGSIGAAHRKVMIMTPYFLPSRDLIATLQAASLRGVEVLVVLPALNNLPTVHWATRNMLWELLKYGVRAFYQPPPFNHSKLFVVDDHYTIVGSANIDARSLRLNFELLVEVFDRRFARDIGAHFEEVLERSREISLEEVDSRPLPVRARDALCWLFSPYL